jgi:hypothetical protein
MKTARTIEAAFERRLSPSESAGRALWNAIRLPLAGVLLLLEPMVGFICGLGLVLGVLASILFEMSAVGPRFPFAKAIGISLSFGVVLFLYYSLLSLFVED